MPPQDRRAKPSASYCRKGGAVGAAKKSTILFPDHLVCQLHPCRLACQVIRNILNHVEVAARCTEKREMMSKGARPVRTRTGVKRMVSRTRSFMKLDVQVTVGIRRLVEELSAENGGAMAGSLVTPTPKSEPVDDTSSSSCCVALRTDRSTFAE